MGGALPAMERAFQQPEIGEAAYRTQRAIEGGGQVVVGVNSFKVAHDSKVPLFRIDEAVQREQVDRLRAVRARRDAARVAAILASLEARARGPENLMPLIVDAVDAHASIGEISSALVRVFGEYRELVKL